MSLLGSIFGGDEKPQKNKKDKKKSKKADVSSNEPKTTGLSGLFEQSSELPERPHHVPKPRKSKRQSEEDDAPKKRRKPRKPKKEDEEEPTTKEGANEKETPTAEQEAEDRTIFVGNLPLQGTTRKSLAGLFRKEHDCGPIASTRIRSVPIKGVKLPPSQAGNQKLVKKICVNTNQVDYENALKDTVQGYVVFQHKDSVEKALALNNQLVVGGKRLRIDRASPTVEPSRSVFCGNLPYQANEASLQAHFVKGCELDAGDVEGVRIIRDKETFQCKGFGYILFKDKSLVAAALKMHDSVYMKKNIRVLVCGKRFKDKKGESGPNRSRVSINSRILGTATVPKEDVTVGAFRRMIAKQTKETAAIQKRKRGEKKKDTGGPKKASTPGVSKRAAVDKKVEMRVKKIQKRINKGMGKTRGK